MRAKKRPGRSRSRARRVCRASAAQVNALTNILASESVIEGVAAGPKVSSADVRVSPLHELILAKKLSSCVSCLPFPCPSPLPRLSPSPSTDMSVTALRNLNSRGSNSRRNESSLLKQPRYLWVPQPQRSRWRDSNAVYNSTNTFYVANASVKSNKPE